MVVTPTHYYEGYSSLLDGGRPVRWTQHPRGAPLYARHQASPLVQRVANFSHGFFKMTEAGGNVYITDLRMGLEPCYSFHFDIGPAHSAASETGPVVQQWQRPDLSMALPWLWRRLTDPTAGTLSTLLGGISCGIAP